MSSPNPYEPPVLPAEVLEPPWPSGGAYRDGAYLVLHHASTLPPICIKSGRPAETQQEYELAGGLPNDGSAPSARKRWYGDKVYVIQLPLTARAVWWGKVLNRLGLGVAAVTLSALPCIGWYYTSLKPSLLPDFLLVGALVGLITSVALLTEARHQLRLECVARGFFWISNLPKRFLKQLPEWPVPRPSFWRRAFFGPAGIGAPAAPLRAEVTEPLEASLETPQS
jgi:hypothetical protein